MSPLSKRRQPPLCFAGSIYGSRAQAVFDMLLEPVELRNDEILKIAPPQKNGPNFQTPYSKSMIMVSFCWKKTILTDEVKNNFMFLIILKELTIISIPFFLGHPVYTTKLRKNHIANCTTRNSLRVIIKSIMLLW